MNADQLFDPDFPHGRPEGYLQGCRARKCPAPFSCTTVHKRWVGDWGFKRRVSAGEDPQALLQAEVDERAAVIARDKAARKAAKISAAAKRRRAQSVTTRTPGVPRTERETQVTALLAEGLTDAQIGDRLGIQRDTVGMYRRRLGLESNQPKRGAVESPLKIRRRRIRELHEAGFADAQIVKELGLSETQVQYMRRRLGLTANRPPKATTCAAGHEYTPENTMLKKNGARRCKTCARGYERDYYERKKAA